MIGGQTTVEGGEPTFEGTLLGGTYRLTAQLGSGGMGDVFQGEHVRLGSPVAVKLLRRSNEHPRSTQRFLQEARTLASIRSDYVVRVFDYGETSVGVPYLVMERLFGEDLRSVLLREGPLPVRRAVRLVMNACRGLSTAHAAGLVHRDLKPANLFVETVSPNAERCKILDFGVAKELASDATHPGSLLGTIRYMAPEQLEDARAATARADIFALGAILFEALAGRPANAGGTQAEIMFRSLHREAPALGDYGPVPPQLAALVGRALSRDPRARFATADEFERALAPFGPSGEAIATNVGSEATTIAESDRMARVRRAVSSVRWVVLAAFAFGAGGGWLSRGAGTSSAAARIAPPSTSERSGALHDAVHAPPTASVRRPAVWGSSSGCAPNTVPVADGPVRPKRAKAARRTASHPVATRFDSENPYR